MVNMNAPTPTSRELERRDRQDDAQVVAQAGHHVDEEPADAVLEESLVFVVRLVVGDPEVEPIAVPAAWLAQAVRDRRDQESGRADHDERPVPAELRADRATERDADAEADDAHDLLHREGGAALLGGVVVGDQAVRRRLRDRLPEPEEGAPGDQLTEVLRRRREHRDAAPRHDGVTDRARPVPPVGEIPRRNGDDPVDEHERRDEHADAEVVDAEVALQLRNDPADEVLVDLVDEHHQPEHPHGPRAHPHRRRCRGADAGGGPDGVLGRVGHGGSLAGWRATRRPSVHSVLCSSASGSRSC
jgi:hypothetical protein